MPDHLNPGTTNPADQSYPAPRPEPASSGPTSAPTAHSTGEMQFPALRPARASANNTLGLAAEIHAGHASHVKFQPAIVAETRPPAINLEADTKRRGGLPINVVIR